MRVLIAGGGIAGLTTAIALRARGAEPLVFERAASAEDLRVGGCIHVWHNGMRGLQLVGAADRLLELAGRAAVVDRAEFRTASGRLMYGWSVKEVERRLGAPTLGVRRPDLHGVLLDTLGEGVVRFGERCVGVEQDADGVRVRLADGNEASGDVLIAADGLRSTLRAVIREPVEPRYAGYVSWQAIATVGPDVVPVGLFRVVWGRGARFLFYRIASDSVYWEGTFAAAAGLSDAVADRRAAVLERFRGWSDPVRTIIEATASEAISRADMYDRRPSRRWGDGRVTLVGDAAHAMTNAMGQGANQAIEDSVVLARSLAEAKQAQDGLRAYEAQRIPRATKFAKLSWTLARASRLQSSVACTVRDWTLTIGFRASLPRTHLKDMDYGY